MSLIILECFINVVMGPVPSKDMQTPPPLKSGDLDIKDAQCAETEDVLKKSYHSLSRF